MKLRKGRERRVGVRTTSRTIPPRSETLAGVRSRVHDRRTLGDLRAAVRDVVPKVFQEDFARAFGPAVWTMAAVFRSTLPEDQRLSAERLVEDLKTAGKDARYIPAVDDIVRTVAKEAKPGDLVVIMSNGGFEDIHSKLLAAISRS
jgi:UDP-N-acetylmuramate: L-alanyl-gamma-D-glutamyl-meso-diaminopimelate ligase